MYKNKKILALIPARGGSKRLPGKNIKPFLGKPLIAWTIKQAKRSKYIDRIIVSTDNEEIAKVAKRYGVEVPFKRPAKLATDMATGNLVILHALNWIEKNEGLIYEYFILLQPTSPLRKTQHIDGAIKKIINDSKADALVSVNETDNMLYLIKKINNKGYVENLIKTNAKHKKEHSIPKLPVINGAIYISKWRAFKKYNDFYKGNCLGFVMDKKSSVDIDNLDDWEYAQYLLKKDINRKSIIN